MSRKLRGDCNKVVGKDWMKRETKDQTVLERIFFTIGITTISGKNFSCGDLEGGPVEVR